MDNFVTHWGAFARRFPSRFALQTIGYIPEKTDWVRCAFTTCNFSFLLSGQGHYRRNGALWKVEAPGVICQWPGEYLEYGPVGGAGKWEELFLIFRSETMEDFRNCGFIRETRPHWKISREERWRAVLAQFIALARKPSGSQADRMDRLGEQLILESLLTLGPAGEASREGQVIRRIQQSLKTELAEAPDFAAEARKHGMSESTFRRRWRQSGETPPGRFLASLRLQEACRQLVESDLAVGEIAAALGFEDPLYFSRKFRAQTGMSATQYRKAYRA